MTNGAYDLPENLRWWFNLTSSRVEQGPGAPNMVRMGPYATREEAETALARARERTEAWDAADEEWSGHRDD